MRKWNTYELNQLIRHGLDAQKLRSTVEENIPVEYITGFASFYGRDFIVNKYTLIPRHETEHIIDIALDYVSGEQLKHVSFIDIGTGSGNIGITFALELNKRGISYTGELIDISTDAVQIAQRNIDNFSVSNVVTRYQNLVTYSIPHTTTLLFANLPYIPTKRLKILQPSVKDFEPRQALDGGDDGLEYIRQLLYKLGEMENPPYAILEVDDSHTDISEFKDFDIRVIHDENDKPRFWVVSPR